MAAFCYGKSMELTLSRISHCAVWRRANEIKITKTSIVEALLTLKSLLIKVIKNKSFMYMICTFIQLLLVKQKTKYKDKLRMARMNRIYVKMKVNECKSFFLFFSSFKNIKIKYFVRIEKINNLL